MKPMLAGKCEDIKNVRVPTLVSPKLDGIRALVINGVVVSRNLKPIPNRYVQRLFSMYEGYDGELIVGATNGDDVFRQTTSGVMSADGEPDVKFMVFDRWDLPGVPYLERFKTVEEWHRCYRVEHHYVSYTDQIFELEERYLASGFEGVMIRDPNSPYKQGRSTWREGWLLKVKRFEDSEALVIGMEEKMHNANESTTNALGHTERSSHIANMRPLNTMGALIVQDRKTGVIFNIGTGFDDAERLRWWNQPDTYVTSIKSDGGEVRTLVEPYRLAKYSYFPSGSKDKPRFPVYLGERNDL